MVKKSKNQFTTQQDASRVQSHADRTGRNQDFKRRMQRAAVKNTRKK